MARTAVSKGVSDILEKQMAGSVPVYKPTEDEINKDIQVMHALNWYNSMANDNKERGWFASYLKDAKTFTTEQLNLIKTFDSSIFSGTGRYCHMITNGFPIESWATPKIQVVIERIKKRFETKQDVSTDSSVLSGPSVQDRMNEKANEFAGNILNHVDEFLTGIMSGDIKKSDDESFFNVESFIKVNDIKPLVANKIVPHVSYAKSEWTEALKNNEGYEHLTESQIKRMIRLYDWILDGLNGRVAEKAVRKTRKRKQKSPQQLTKNVKYLAKSDEYSIESTTPDKIIGAERLITFNVKYREFSIYESKSAGFTIKGTTIQNIDESKSTSKKIREKYLKDLLKTASTQGIRAIRNAYQLINSKDSVPTGRLNGDTLIVKVL